MEDPIRSHLATLEVSPANRAAFAAAEELLSGGGRWEELLRLYESRMARLPDDPGGAELLARTAQLLHEKLADPGRAEGYFRRLLQRQPNSAVALSGLHDIFQARGDGQALVALLEAEAAQARTPEAAAAAWLEAGRNLEERLGRRERALLHYLRALRFMPHHREALRRARQAYAALGRLDAARALLDAEAATDPTRAGALVGEYAELGRLAAEHPTRHELARSCAEAALALDPGCGPARALLLALEALQRGWRDQARSLRSRAVEERDRRAAARLYLQIAELHAAFDPEPTAAARIQENLGRAFLLWPGMPGALELLEQQHARTGDGSGYARALESLAATVTDRVTLVDVHLRLSVFHAVRGGDRLASLAALEKASALDPSRSDAAWQLTELLVEENRIEDAVAVLERHLAATSDRSAQVELRLQIAALLVDRADDPQRARAHLEAALRQDPGCARADDRLELLLDPARDRDALAALLRRRIDRAADPRERLRLLDRLAALLPASERLAVLERSLLIDPARPRTRKELEEAAQEAQAPAELARIYRVAVDVAESLDVRKDLLRRAAAVLEGLGRPGDAAAEWRRLLEIDPADEVAAGELEAALARSGEYAALAADWQSRLAATQEPAARRSLLVKLAAHHETQGADPAAAVEIYRQLLEVQPDDGEVKNRLAAALGTLERWDEQLEVLGDLAQQGGAAGAQARARAGLLLLDRLGRPEEAAARLLPAFDEAPEQPGLVPALERLLAANARAGEVAARLAAYHAARGDHARSALMIEKQLEGEPDPVRRLVLERRLADLHEQHLGDSRGAFSALSRAFPLAPGDADLRARLEALCAALQNPAELADLYRSAWQDPRAGPALAARVADIARTLGDRALLRDALARTLELSPRDVPALTELASLAEEAEAHEDSAAWLERLAGAVAPAERPAVLRRRGQALMRLPRPDAAAEAFQAAIDAGGPEAEILPELVTALRTAGAREAEAEATERRLAIALEQGDAAEVLRLRAEHARQLEDLGRVDDAAAEWTAILQLSPTEAAAVAALERHLEDPRRAAAAARSLEIAYAASRDLRQLARAVEIQAAAAPDATARVRELRRLAQLAVSDLQEPQRAFDALARALHDAPFDPLLRSELRLAAREADAHERHAQVLQDVALGLPPGQAIPLERELAELLEKRLGDRPGAVERHRRILSAEPADPESLLALHRLLRLAEDWEGLHDVCVALGEAAPDPADRARYLREAGQLAEEMLRDPSRAIAAHRRVLEADPSDRAVALVLDRLLGAEERFEEQAWVLELRRSQALELHAQNPGDPQHGLAARELGLRLADLRRTRLGEVEGALALLGEVLADEPRHPGARAALEEWLRTPSPGSAEALAVMDRVLSATGEHARRVELRESRLAVATREERAALFEQVRELQERVLQQPRAAFETCRRAFTELGGGEDWRLHLERLARAGDAHDELAEVYEEAASWLSPGEEQALAWRRRAAEIHERDLRDAEGAIAAWNRVLEAAPTDRAALDALGRLYAEQKQGGQLYQLYRRDAELAATVPDRIAWLLKAADLCATQIADDARAIATYREVLDLEPGNAAALEALDRLYSRDRVKHGADLQGVLERQAELAPRGSEARLRALARRAALHEESGDPAEALDVLEALLAEAPDFPPAVAQAQGLLSRPDLSLRAAVLLEPTYRRQGDAAHLAQTLQIRAAGAAEASLRRELLAELAALREEHGDRVGAFAAALQLLRTGGDPEALGLVVRLGREAGAHEELASTLEEDLQRRGPADGGAPVVLRILAQTYAGPLARPQAAAQALERLLRLDPEDDVALGELGGLYRAMGAVRELVSVHERRAGLERDPDRRKDVYFEMANLLEEQLADRDGAIDVYRRILEIDAADESAMSMLSRLLGETQRWDELAALLQQQVETAKGKGLVNEARELRFRLGRVHQVRLEDPTGAVNLYRGVLAEQPRHPATLGALEEMTRSARPEERASAAELLAPIYSAEGDHARAVAMLEALAAVAPEAATRAALFRRIAEVQLASLGAPDMALLAAGRALHEVPDDPEALKLALRAGTTAGAAEELAALLDGAAAAARTEPGRITLRRELARLHERAGHGSQAASEWRRLRASAPDDAEALEALTRLAAAAGDVEGYLEALRARLARADDAKARRDLLFEIAVAQEERARDMSGAMATYRRLLDLAPLDAEALSRMDLLCVRGERWTDLADVLAREEQSAEQRGDGRARVEYLHRLAHLKESRLLDREGALELYRKVLELAPAHADTVARLEAMLARDPGVGGAAEALEAVFLATQNWPKYAAALEARAATAADPEVRRTLLVQLARVREEKQRRPDMAFMALTRAFREAPGHPEVRVLLERAAEAAEAVEELAALYEEQVPRITDGAVASGLALRAADLYETRLGDSAQALRWYERARDLDPETGARALPLLERLYRAGGKFPELAATLEAMAAREKDPRERTAVLFRLGQLCADKLKDPDRALIAYEKLLEIEPKNLPALRAAEPLLEHRLDAHALYANLLTQREADPQARDRLTAKLAKVAEAGLMDAELAITHHREMVSRQPRTEASWQALETLLERAQRWAELVDVLRARLPHTTDPREINRLHEKLGALLAERMGSQDDAIASFHSVLERDPKNRRALESLRDLHAARGEHDQLAAVLRRLVPLQDDARGVKEVRLELAETLASLGKREEAVESGKRVLDLEPHDPLQLARAEALFRDLAAWPEAIRTMELQAQMLDPRRDQEDAVALWTAVAHLWEHEMKRPEGGALALEKVLELKPHDRTAFDGLRGIYRSVADWRRYAQITERFVAEAVDAAEKVGLLRDVAVVHEQRLGQRDIAFAKLGAAFELHPHDPELRASLERLAGEGRMYEELAMVYESVADATPRGPVAASLYLELARVQDEKLDEPESAEQSLRKLLEFDPGNADALQALGLLFARRGQHAPYVLALEQKLEATASLEDKKSILHEIARVYDERLHDSAEAVYSLRRALELDPGDGVATDMLAAIYRRDRRWQELAALLARARDYQPDPARRAALQLGLAELHENELADDESALRAYAMALEIDPGSLPALDALERLYTRMDRAAELLQVYDRRIDLVEDPGERARILLKAAGIWEEKLGSAPNAIACLEGVVQLEGDNLPALKSLEALLRQEKRFDRLIEVLEHHAALIEEDPAQRAELSEVRVRMGDVWEDELHRPDRAEAAFQAALSLDPDSRAAAGGLARVYESTGNWQQALEMLRREARLAGGARDAVEIFHRIGRIHADMLLDPAGARSAFQMALDLDPGHLSSIRGLRAVHETQADVSGVLEALVQEATFTENAAEKTRLYDEVGRIHLETRQDREAAARAYEEARRHTADDLAAARALSEIYVGWEDWPRAEEVLDITCAQLSVQGTPESVRELTHRVYRLGFVCEKLGKVDKARRSYGNAYELDPTFLPAAESYAHLLGKSGEHAQALKVYQAILIHHRDDLTDPEVVEIHFAVGDLRARLGDREAALKSFANALDLDPWHVESHRSLVRVYEELKDFDTALEHRRKLMEVLEGEEKLAILLDTARVAADVLGDPYQAIDCLEGALRLRPDDRAVIERLLALYRQTKQGPKAAELLERWLLFPDLPQAEKIQAHAELGLLYRDDLREVDGALGKAVASFNAALDLDWRRSDAFSALEGMLGQAKEWRQLEQNYVRMLGRLPKEESTRTARVLLYRTLAELYLRALKDPAAALEAYRALTILAPDDARSAELYAELLAQKPGAEDEAVAAFRKVLLTTPEPEKPVQQLVLLHARRKELDRSYVAAQVSAYLLGKPGRDEAGIIEKLRRFARDTATRPLPPRSWSEHLFHPQAKGPIGEILSLVYGNAGALFAQDHGKLEVQGREVKLDRRRDRVELKSSMLFFANAYKVVARTLGLEAVELYKTGGVSGLHVANTFPVCVVAGEDLFAEQRSKKELYYLLGKHLAFTRPELALAQLHRFEELQAILEAAVRLGEPRLKHKSSKEELDRIGKKLEKSLSPAAAESLKKLAYQYTRDPSKPTLKGFVEGAEYTATRVGVLLGADLQLGWNAVQRDPGMAARLPTKDRQRDLLVFCMSDAYFELREALGLSVAVPG